MMGWVSNALLTSLNYFEEITTHTTLNHFDYVLTSWPFKIPTFLEPGSGRFRQQEARYLYKRTRGMKGPRAVARVVIISGGTERGRRELRVFPSPL